MIVFRPGVVYALVVIAKVSISAVVSFLSCCLNSLGAIQVVHLSIRNMQASNSPSRRFTQFKAISGLQLQAIFFISVPERQLIATIKESLVQMKLNRHLDQPALRVAIMRSVTKFRVNRNDNEFSGMKFSRPRCVYAWKLGEKLTILVHSLFKIENILSIEKKG